MVKKKLIFNVFLSFLILSQGCGYTTKAYFLPSQIRSVYIEIFHNQTDQPNLETDLRTKLVSAFQNDGNLKIVAKEDADVILKGELVEYSRQALRYANDEAVREYRLNISVNFEFFNVSNNEIIVKENNFMGDTSFYLTGSSAKSESSARQEALDDLAHRILNRIITLW